MLRFILAIFLPWLVFFTIGRPISGIICLIIEVFAVGSIFIVGPFSSGIHLICVIWAIFALSQYGTDQKIKKALGE